MRRCAWLFFLLLLSFAAYAVLTMPSKDIENPMPDQISIKVGESAADFMKRLPFARVQKQPAGLNFYKIPHERGKERRSAVVAVEHGSHSFNIPGVLSISGTEDLEFPNEGISDFDFSAEVNADEFVKHDEARKYFFGLLGMIKAAGWQRVIYASHARLVAKDAFNETLKQSQLEGNLSADYEPSLNEWMQLKEMTDWRFYADGVYLSVYFLRDSKRLDPNQPGAYLISISLSNAESNFRSNFEQNDWPRARELWPELIKEFQMDRKKAEAKAQAAGLKIDTTYQDPPMPPL